MRTLFAVRCSSVALAVSAVLTAVAFADDTKPVKIPAGDLATAIKELARQSGVELFYRPEQLRGLRTKGVEGTLSSQEAVIRLLEGTPLKLSEDPSGILMISASDAQASASGSATGPKDDGRARTQLAGLGSRAHASSRPAENVLEEVLVRGFEFNYGAIQSANKMTMSVKDTPQSVKVVTEDMLNFARITDLGDLYKLDAGVHATHSGIGYSWGYFRGFDTGYAEAYKVDGFRVPGRARLDLAPYERMEIIKGATSTLYGQSAVAGTLNVISKKPQPGFGGAVKLEAGSYGHYRGDVDVFGSLTNDDRLTFRFVGAWLDENSYIDLAYRKQLTLAPSIAYQLSSDTSVLLQVNYQKYDYLPFEGYAPQQVGADASDPASYQFPDVPRSRLGGAAWNVGDRQAIFARTFMEHRYANDWKLRANLQYSNISGVVKRANLNGFSDAAGRSSVYIYLDDTSDPVYSAEVNLFGDVALFGRRHTLFLGVDHAELRTHTRWGGALLTREQSGFSILEPDYSAFPDPVNHRAFLPDGIYGGNGKLWKGDNSSQRSGITVQALLKPSDRLTLLLGSRYSQGRELTRNGYVATFSQDSPAVRSPDVDEVTFQTGATYAVTPNLNVYAAYGETFEPRNAFAFDPEHPEGSGINLGPEEGVTYELGLKGEFAGRRISWSLDYFYTARTSVLEVDHQHPKFSKPFGRQRTTGVEFDLQGELRPGWDAYLSAVAMDNEFTEGELAGRSSPFSTPFAVTLFSSYEIQRGTLQGVGFGGGIVHKQRLDYLSQGMAFSHLFKDYTELDFRAFYTRGPWRYQLSATNVLDAKYFSPVFAQDLACCLAVNPPRQVIGIVTRSF